MKIGIITFHAAHNYGSMLQAYALQTYLEQQGHHVEIINFRSKIQRERYSKVCSFANIHNIKSSIKRILLARNTIKPLNKKWYLFEDFLASHLHLTKEYNTLEQLKEASFDYDYIITGSDQIWNTNAFDFSPAYFATFAKPYIKKIAYAPSMGPEPESLNKNYIKTLLNGYVAVSVREERTKNFLEENHIYEPVKVVLDPTMLLNVNEYACLYSDKPLISEKYIFYYTPGGIRPEFMEMAERIGDTYDLPVITDGAYYSKDMRPYKRVKQYLEVGPSEFLNLVKNASVVCGASFHLMVFAILFNKDFYCINGDIDSRMNNLMRIMNTEDRIISIQDKFIRTKELSTITTHNMLEIYKSKSKYFLSF